MNTTQRKVLVAVAVAVLGMLLYPPYQAYFLGKLSETGYAWIFDLPDRATVNIATLILQWIGIAIVGGIAFFLASETDGPRPLVKKMPPPLTDEGASIREVVPSESIAVNDAGLESVSSSSDSPKITKRSGLRILIYLIAVFVGVRVFGIIGGVSLIAMYAVWHALQNKGAEIRYSGVAGVLLVGIFIYLGTTAYFSKVSGEASDLGKDLNGLAEGGSAEATTAQSQQPSDVLANPPAQTQSDSVKPSSEDVIQAKYESDLTKMVPDWKQINVRKDFLA